MIIKVSQLRHVTIRLFDHLEEQGVTSIDISQDHYWNITSGQKYDSYSDPSEFTIGQLTHDWQELMKLLKSESEPLTYNFVWLAAILRAAGENLIT